MTLSTRLYERLWCSPLLPLTIFNEPYGVPKANAAVAAVVVHQGTYIAVQKIFNGSCGLTSCRSTIKAMDLRYRVIDQSESRTSDIRSYTRKADCNQSPKIILFHNLLMVFISAYILTFVIICGLVPMNTESTRSRLL